MDRIENLGHAKWECKYHLIWMLKYRKKQRYGDLRKYMGEISQNWKER